MTESTQKVYKALKSMFKPGKSLTLISVAKRVRRNAETVRRHVLKLVKIRKVKRVDGHIVNVI